LFRRGPLIIIALLAVIFAACSGPDALQTETATPEPDATSTATVEPSPMPTVTPSPTPTPAPSPTPEPICNTGDVAAVLDTFIAAYNRGDWDRLSQFLPATSHERAPGTIEPGMDTSLFHGSRIATEVRGGETDSDEIVTGKDLLDHMQIRHGLGERWEAGNPTIQPYGRDPGWKMPDAAQVSVEITRSASDLTERIALVNGVINCREGTVIYWQVSDNPLPPVEILALSLNDIDDEPLRFLSADEHPYFDGYTLLHGAISIAGDGALADVVLEVLEDGVVVATGELREAARELLIGPFGDQGLREIGGVQPLFRIASEQFQSVDQDRDGWLTLRVRATTTEGDESIAAYGTPVGKLVLYRGDNRYLMDEEDRGGNDWVQPSVRNVISGWEDVLLGDFSDMNGGPYPPHISHQEGLDVDIWFFGYNEMDGHAAETMLSHIDRKPYTGRIELVYAAYEPVDGNPFWEVISAHTLSDGRAAAEVILPEEDHTGHFHVRFTGLLDE
jgi:hypothetical protein